jgi:hypothetical protein
MVKVYEDDIVFQEEFVMRAQDEKILIIGKKSDFL